MLQITKYQRQGFTELSLRGDIDREGAMDLKVYLEEMYRAGDTTILLNFTRIFRVNYTDMQSLTRTIEDFLSVGKVGICGIPESVEPVLRSTPYFVRLSTFEDKQEAQLAMAK